jgi:hypothetical protein
MKEKYKELPRYRKRKAAILEVAKQILAKWELAGTKKTLRGLHYELADINAYANTDSNWNTLSEIITAARWAGVVDWAALDLLRLQIRYPNEFENMQQAIEELAEVYRLPRWANQPEYVEVWIEKDTLTGLLEPITKKYHVRYVTNSGFASKKAIYDASERFKEVAAMGKDCTMIYLGDHDPAGISMYDSIKNDLTAMYCPAEVVMPALTKEQIRKYGLLPQPLKPGEKKKKKYIETTGCTESWELDALPPNVLEQVLIGEIEKHLDKTKYNEIIEREQQDKEKLRKFVKGWRDE